MVLRFLITIFELVVNDLIFFFHQLNFVIWILFSLVNLYAYLVVLSNYQELHDLTKLTDLAKEKISSSNMSRSVLQDTSHLNALSTISNKLSISTPSQSISGSTTISESLTEKIYKEQQQQLIQQQQQMQQLKLNQAYNQIKNSQCPIQSPLIL